MNGNKSNPMLVNLVQEMRQHWPFSQMSVAHVEALAKAGEEKYALPDFEILGPAAGVPEHLYWLRQGRVMAQPLQDGAHAKELDVGDFWPVGALISQRTVNTRYTALQDCFYWRWPWSQMQALVGSSPVWADFLDQRVQLQLAQSLSNLRQAERDNAQQQSLMSVTLSQLPTKELVTLDAQASIHKSLMTMVKKKTGSVLILNDAGRLEGILTRWDVLERVALAQINLDLPTREVMTQPVWTVDASCTGIDAALLMSRHGVRHLPVLSKGELVNMVSERDLFSFQNLTLSQSTQAIAVATCLSDLQMAASHIRKLTAQWTQQGMHAFNLTALISALNDRLSRKLIEMSLQKAGLSEQDMCWLALGSEGRSEQTIATDQDNALIFSNAQAGLDKHRWLAFAHDVNAGLEACGFPLCRGDVMARNPECCLSLDAWKQRFADWIDRGSPEDLLKAAVFFDFRGLAGQQVWVEDLRRHVMARIRSTPRFIHQCVENNQTLSVPLNWYGGLQATQVGQQRVINLKLSGTALVVDAARIMALAKGVVATSTVQRLQEVGPLLNVPDAEFKAWISAFEYLQTIRLQLQIQPDTKASTANHLALDGLNLVDQRMLKVAFSAVRGLQQRLSLDDLR